ncbi:hypothetical protein MMC06_006525 [Schaereria dolodes]|nr:hypothetical protein [Schaereria dolodes]
MEFLYSFDYYTESWIEVSSQPSSSSLSSAATDDVVTTGLRAQHDNSTRRRRRPHPNAPFDIILPARASSAGGSSQEEYEESESESDRIMSSSNEELRPRFAQVSSLAPLSSASEDVSLDEAEDDDENSTALGVTHTEPVFTPQPNVFSHPPASQLEVNIRSVGLPDSYFPTQRSAPSRGSAQRHSYPQQRARSHTPYNMISPSSQVDHDAALRASLSTLLSCAAAARGLPKRDRPIHGGGGPSHRIEPSSIRVVPESILMGGDISQQRPTRQASNTSSSSPSIQAKGKRKAVSRDRHDIKKKRRASVDEMMISPTLMTWVVSAGVVVLFSAISFSAGYAYGKEVGQIDGSLTTGGEGVTCGKEVERSLRRLRWGTSSTVVNV